ncbi:hypothetical protein B0H11DRAFT_2252033 [Mycena galericulata]|nr:hypothetical protein B0H11DRAFT_2252033 [Mycena galericulata]
MNPNRAAWKARIDRLNRMREDPVKGPELERRLSLLKGQAAEEFRLLLEHRRRIVGLSRGQEEVSNEVEVLPQPPLGFVYVVEHDAICLAKLDADGKPGATIYIADARDLRVLKRKRRCSADEDATKRARYDAPPNVELAVAQGQKRPRDDDSDREKHMALKRACTESDQSEEPRPTAPQDEMRVSKSTQAEVGHSAAEGGISYLRRRYYQQLAWKAAVAEIAETRLM